jgi:ankyrin repeat protein
MNIEVNAIDYVAMETPLHKALRYNMLENAKFLLRAGADVNIADVTGETSMHCAARKLTDLSAWVDLINARGDITARNNAGWTVRRVAEEAKNSVAKSVLAQYEVDFTN